MFILSVLLSAAFTVAVIAFILRPTHYLLLAAKCMGLGYLTWHSDSGKYFYSLTKRNAMQWLGATYSDSAVFSNWTKEALFVRLTSN